MAQSFTNLLNIIKQKEHKFVNPDLTNIIKKCIRDLFPNLNNIDIIVLEILTIYIVDIISFKNHFEKTEDYYNQWKQNNSRDIKGVILLLLPFIDDQNNGILLQKLTDLNQFLYKNGNATNIIPYTYKNIEATKFLEGAFSNMAIGLIDNTTIKKDECLLELNYNNEKLIYHMIYHNLLGLLQTLEIINGKYYINWINIRPLNLSNYSESNIFKATYNELMVTIITERKVETIDKTIINYNGLWMGDIYNILKKNFYEGGKKIKWMIFPYEFDKKQIYLIQGLHYMFDINTILNSTYNNFNDINDIDRIKFETKVNNTFNSIEMTQSIVGNFTVDIEILKFTLIYLINSNNKMVNIINDNVEKFKFKSEDNLDDDNMNEYTKNITEIIDNITPNDVIGTFKFIKDNNISDLWNHLKNSINMLIQSTYGKFLFNETFTEINIDYYYYQPFAKKDNNSSINLKNIYNIAKSLCHTSVNKEWTKLGDYITLTNDNKKSFFRSLESTELKKKVKISNNLNKQFVTDKSNMNNKMDDILASFINYLLNIIFEEVVTSGLLNEFKPNGKLTDNNLLPNNYISKKKKKKQLFEQMFKDNNEQWNDSYYYITNKKFKYLQKLRIEKKDQSDMKNKYDEKNYFSLIGDDQDWPTFYAMDWISQISFFQHYIYHQVLYVTGATGQGKSTQAPKLLLYALKMIDYKNDGRVICTQPRVTPTIGNATRIAEELGIPIEQVYNSGSGKLKTNNYYVQYKYQGDEHTNSMAKHQFLKIVTDGTLLEEIKTNPTMRRQKTIGKNSVFTDDNIYDIIIIDEAHEHNFNMDIIITLAKQSCYFNNKIKLIIVSATMEDDEPIYRRYFQTINDNLMYPIKSLMKCPFFNTDILPQPIFMDRRYHISPPGETTQYKVTENYLENDPPGNNLKEVAMNAQEMGYQKIIEICNSSSKGEILFFANGEREIKMAVEYLNQNLPMGCVALPFFSKLNEIYKDIVTHIDKKISGIKNKRENIINEWGTDYIVDNTVSNGIYRRAVIIATNVAEASVTIPGLEYVVDNGYAKVNFYNAPINLKTLSVDPISEASRKQRKGRVGRIGDGTVYYMYKKDARKDIKPKYKITQENVAESFLDLLAPIEFKDIKNFNFKKKYDKLIFSDRVNSFPNNLSEDVKKNYYLIKNNYNLNNDLTINDTIYYYFEYQDNMKDIIILKEKNILPDCYYVFHDGQMFNNILDQNGQFFLIHSLENNITRNILNEIIKYKNLITNSIPFIEFRFILSYYFNYNLIIDLSFADIYYSSVKTNQFNSMNIIKTELATYIEGLNKLIDFRSENTVNDMITIISSIAMGCFNEVYMILIFLRIIENKLETMVREGYKWKQFKDRHGSQKSEILFIYNIIKDFKDMFKNLLVFNQVKLTKKLDSIYQDKKDQFVVLHNKNKEPSDNNFDVNLWSKLAKAKTEGNLEKEYKEIFKDEDFTKKFIRDDINNNEEDIIKWCNNYCINSKIILKFLNEMVKKYPETFDKNNNNYKWAESLQPNFNRLLTDGTIDEKIIRSFIYGRPTNFCYPNKKGGLITDMNFKLINLWFQENKFFNKDLIEKSEIMYFHNYMDASNSVEEDKKIEIDSDIDEEEFDIEDVKNINPNVDFIQPTILSRIDSRWLIPALPLIINPRNQSDIIKQFAIYEKEQNVKLSYNGSYCYDIFKKEIMNNWSIDSYLWTNNIVTPLLNYYYKTIIKYGKP
jgi:hypothetical protein